MTRIHGKLICPKVWCKQPDNPTWSPHERLDLKDLGLCMVPRKFHLDDNRSRVFLRPSKFHVYITVEIHQIRSMGFKSQINIKLDKVQLIGGR